MSYEAIITKITNIREHPNADKLKLGTASGFQVVVDLSQEEELGVFFPTDGKLSPEMLLNNNLYRKHPDTGELMGGFFEQNGRVRTQIFRGEKSEGFWIPLVSLVWTGVAVDKLKAGFTFAALNGMPICEKYYSPTTIKMMGVKGRHTKYKVFPHFYKHYDTKKLAYYIDFIKKGSILSLTEKLHGSSGRTSRARKVPENHWWNLWNTFKSKSSWEYVSGSRNMILSNPISTNIHVGEVRKEIHDRIKTVGLHKGETLYYEIIGFDKNNTPIMGTQKIVDKDLITMCGATMIYAYGCSPVEPYDFRIYRITTTNEDGCPVEYSPQQVERRCGELGFGVVPWVVFPFVYNGNVEELLSICQTASVGSSLLDVTTIREGIVLRDHSTDKAYKLKNFKFLELEDRQKADDNYVDTEEVS